MREGARCRACQKPLVWALTPKGEKAPIEAEPSEDGNVLLLAPSLLGGEYLAVVLSASLLDSVRERGAELRLNHFATCPKREEFKR